MTDTKTTTETEEEEQEQFVARMNLIHKARDRSRMTAEELKEEARGRLKSSIEGVGHNIDCAAARHLAKLGPLKKCPSLNSYKPESPAGRLVAAIDKYKAVAAQHDRIVAQAYKLHELEDAGTYDEYCQICNDFGDAFVREALAAATTQ